MLNSWHPRAEQRTGLAWTSHAGTAEKNHVAKRHVLLGAETCFVLVPEGSSLKLPSDVRRSGWQGKVLAAEPSTDSSSESGAVPIGHVC